MSWLPSVQYDPSGTHGHGQVDREAIARREQDLAKIIGDVLFQVYPNFLWGVHVDLHTKYKAVTVHLPVLMPHNKKYIIPIRYLGTLADINRVVRNAGGEILERYKIPRTGLKIDSSAFASARDLSIRSLGSYLPT